MVLSELFAIARSIFPIAVEIRGNQSSRTVPVPIAARLSEVVL